MGLLEYQAMPSLCDVAYDGWLCTFTIKQQQEIPSVRSWAAPVRETGTEKAGVVARLSRTKSHLPGHPPPASKAGRRVGPELKPSVSLFWINSGLIHRPFL